MWLYFPMAKKRRRKSNPYDDVVDVVAFGTGALVGLNVFNTIAART